MRCFGLIRPMPKCDGPQVAVRDDLIAMGVALNCLTTVAREHFGGGMLVKEVPMKEGHITYPTSFPITCRKPAKETTPALIALGKPEDLWHRFDRFVEFWGFPPNVAAEPVLMVPFELPELGPGGQHVFPDVELRRVQSDILGDVAESGGIFVVGADLVEIDCVPKLYDAVRLYLFDQFCD